MEPSFDIQSPSTEPRLHHSHRFVLIVSILIIVLAVVLIFLRLKQKRAHDAYIRTPEGQLQALETTSAPITATDQERYDAMMRLQQNSKATVTQEDGLEALKSLQ
jgi:hypothetical protein